MKKIAFVTPWFGEKIPGGAEMELRGLVTHLHKAGIPLEILTTCVKEFSSDWNINYHKEGQFEEMGLTVRRFAVRQRDTDAFDAVNFKLMNKIPVSLKEETIYFKEMINSDSLYAYINSHQEEYSIFVFIPYMFGTTYYGCQICPEKSILIPCLHDESYAYMEHLKEIFPKVGGMIFHSKPEEILAKKIYGLSSVNYKTLGEGVCTDISYNADRFKEKFKIAEPFILYAGRKDAGKNVDLLVKYFEKYKERNNGSALKLVLIGGGTIDIPASIENDVHDLGFVDLEDKFHAYAAASFLCQPSNNESFSLVIMESWLCRRPVLVSGKCEVTKYFATESNAGLYFNNYFEFEESVGFLLNNAEHADFMGENGRNFVMQNFSWDIIVRNYCEFFEEIASEAEIKHNKKNESKLDSCENKGKRKKIAFVNQRYGLEVNGGSELLCRQLAEKLIEHYDVEVLTTCALDYMTWENVYREGTEIIHGVTVRRFPVDESRNIEYFNSLSQKVLGGAPHSAEEELEWIKAQGPYCPKFISFMDSHSSEYDCVIYMTYLYYLTAVGILKHTSNTILMPTAHDELPIYLRYYENVFKAPKGLMYNSPEEKEFVENKFGVAEIPSIITGAGVDLPDLNNLLDAEKAIDYDGDYIIYVGRVDESKGCKMLFDYFIQYKARNSQQQLKLVLVGKSVMNIPNHTDIISLGFIEEELKFSLMKSAKALVLASEFESLSMVVLESMSLGRPVIVNGNCQVLKGHCIRSNAGLYFTNYFEFEAVLLFLLNQEQIYSEMQKNAVAYINNNYQWDVIIHKITTFIDAVL